MTIATSVSAEAASGTAVTFATLPGFATEDHRAVFQAFRASCVPIVGDVAPLRAALPTPRALKAICVKAMARDPVISNEQARAFLEANFAPRRIGSSAFFTGYYEPVVEGSLIETADFATPLYGRPADLVTAERGQTLAGVDPSLSAARRLPDGRLVPMPDRAAIEGGALHAKPLVFLRDPVEAFFTQVQGSARVKLTDGSLRRLVYAGRNGYPYTSIGKILVDALHIAPERMGMTQLKAWIRANGEAPGEAGAGLMQRNRSYIFFSFDETLPPDSGPIGGAGVSLTALRSLAIDRTLWPYGLPFYVDATLPWIGDAPTPFRRLMIGEDTGSAIVGRARGDIFFGTGAEAARLAGAVRNDGTLFVLWPKDEDAAP